MKSGVGIGNLSVYVIMFLKLPLEFFVFVRIQNFILHDQLAGRIFSYARVMNMDHLT
jgi:hypothetical protein